MDQMEFIFNIILKSCCGRVRGTFYCPTIVLPVITICFTSDLPQGGAEPE